MFDNWTDSCVLHENEQFMHSRSNQYGENCPLQTVADVGPDVSTLRLHSHTTDDMEDSMNQFYLTRLNDVLRSCGISGISSSLTRDELIIACTEAVLQVNRISLEKAVYPKIYATKPHAELPKVERDLEK